MPITYNCLCMLTLRLLLKALESEAVRSPVMSFHVSRKRGSSWPWMGPKLSPFAFHFTYVSTAHLGWAANHLETSTETDDIG